MGQVAVVRLKAPSFANTYPGAPSSWISSSAYTPSSIIFILRDVLPSAAFWPNAPANFPATYLRAGRICDVSESLSGACVP
jgi:hypothetical protein